LDEWHDRAMGAPQIRNDDHHEANAFVAEVHDRSP